MPRYYLHFRDGNDLGEDPEGIVLPDLDAAYAQALVMARGMRHIWSDFLPEVLNEMAFEIADEIGRMLMVVPFSEAEGETH
jgi:hypothetical protein